MDEADLVQHDVSLKFPGWEVYCLTETDPTPQELRETS